MDHNVGRLLDTLDELGLRDGTIVVFTSDNGADISTPPWTGTSGPWTGAMFTLMEGNNRVPFIVRWPGQIPADRELNEIVYEVDTFTTLARFAGAEVPQDQPIDGVDQGDFFRGKTDRSAREGFSLFFGDKLYGAKWRNFKMLLVDQADAEAPLQTLSVPRIYDLYTNPHEVVELNLFTTYAWVLRPISEMIGEYRASLKQYPPIPVGSPDPYKPPGR